MGVSIVRHVDRELPLKVAVRVEHLDAAVAAVGDVDVAAVVAGDRMQNVELSLPRPALAPRFHPASGLVDLHDARVVVAVGDEDVAVRVPRDVGRAIERSPPGPRHRPRRRLHRRLDGFGAAAEHHQHAPGRVELHDHVRAFVRRPEVAALVDADRVREGESVEILADLADERAVGSELEQLRRRLAVQRAAAAGAREHVEMLARVDRDAGDFAEVHVRGHLEKIDARVEADFGNGLLGVGDGWPCAETGQHAQRDGGGSRSDRERWGAHGSYHAAHPY